ncbi:MAG: hypothetical protein JWM04_1830 [Verrucomicrobiales bacterium]|nr:hypothetical protein [Verrucomicrobiales bacterium]
MSSSIRAATPSDAFSWLELAKTSIGADYPSPQVYKPEWFATEADAASGNETWVSETGGVLDGTISILGSGAGASPIANLGRQFFRPASYANGSAILLLKAVLSVCSARNQMIVVRVPAADNLQQILFENAGFVCSGFQPFKHMLQTRVSALFYVYAAEHQLVTRLQISESLIQISELACVVLERLNISTPLKVRDGVTGYPLQSDLKFHDGTFEEYEIWRTQAEASNPPLEISGSFNQGAGMMRLGGGSGFRILLGQRNNVMVAGVAYILDEVDRCVRVVQSFTSDDLSTGTLLQQLLKISQEQLNAVFVEIDILATAPRLLKSAEQLGFVPVAYLPGFYRKADGGADVVKMVKLNLPYSLDGVDLTAHAKVIATIVDNNFKDQKLGVAIINLLRTLPIFEGLGDGELRKIARLFTQKLYRPGERIFRKGDSGEEAFIVMRGQVDIQLEEEGKPIANVPSGKIFGELAFLDGAPRNAFAIANQASILLVLQRAALNDLVQREPHLGMVVMRNIAMDLSMKLRQANNTLAQLRK